MFAVIEIGGSQYKVSPNDVIEVNRIDAEEGTTMDINEIVIVSTDDKDATIGTPYVSGAGVKVKVVEHLKGDKIRVFKFRAKKRFQLTKNHRQPLTKLEILEITA